MEPPAIVSASPFPSRAIFWPSGLTLADPGGLFNAGAAYLYQLEANGSATYLTKVTAPDGVASDISDLRFPVGQYSGRRGTHSRPGGAFQCRSCLSLSIGSQWIRYLPDQGDGSRWSTPAMRSEPPFLSRAIFLPSGQTGPIRGAFLCRGGVYF